MPLACLNELGELLDAATMSDDAWAKIYRVDPPAKLKCRSCGNRVHAKVSSKRRRFYAHNRKQPDCRTNGETELHRRLKTVIAEHVVGKGWTAEKEANEDAWQADVLATSPNGSRRIAFEVQVSPKSVPDGESRMQRHRTSGVETIWVATRRVHWLHYLPGVELRLDEDDDDADIDVVAGCWQWVGTGWGEVDPFTLRMFVRCVLAGTLRLEQPEVGIEAVWTDPDTAPLAWVKPAHWKQELKQHRDRDQHQRMRDALVERQQRLTPIALARIEHLSGRPAWIGDRFSRRPGREGEYEHGTGVPIYVGDRGAPTLFAVVCPVASRLDDRHGIEWPNVAVVADSDHEMEQLQEHLPPAIQVVVLQTGNELDDLIKDFGFSGSVDVVENVPLDSAEVTPRPSTAAADHFSDVRPDSGPQPPSDIDGSRDRPVELSFAPSRSAGRWRSFLDRVRRRRPG